jgi:hypothetical protein
MPYANIVFVKLQIELLRDFRFTDQLNDRQKLLYLGLILVAGASGNKIPAEYGYIKRVLNLESTPEQIESDIKFIMQIYPKCLHSNGMIQFENFDRIHSYVREKNRMSEGKNKARQITLENKNKNKNKEIDIEKDIYIDFPYLQKDVFKKTFLSYLKNRKRKATEHARELILKDLHKEPIDVAIAMLEQSIKNGWIGVFKLKEDSHGRKPESVVGQVGREDSKYSGIGKKI